MSRRPPPLTAPTDAGSAILIGLGVMIGGLSVLVPVIAPLGIGGGALVVGLGMRQRVFGRAVVRTHAALQAITRGQIEEAEAHLDAIPRWLLRSGTIMRSAAYQRALVAFYRSDAAGAVAALERATTKRAKTATQNYEHMQRSNAVSLRALAYAAMGDAERARADASDVQASVHATPEALARARIAEAVVLARAGATDTLAAHFRAHGSLMLEHAFPRERVLVRALRKMVQSRARSVYREPARPEEEHRPTGAIGEWIASIAPDAAVHATDAARLADRADAPALPAASLDGIRAAHAARTPEAKQPRRASPRLLRAAAAVAVAFVAYYGISFFEASGRTSGEGEGLAVPSAPGLAVMLLVVVGAIFAVGILQVLLASRRVREEEREVLAAQRALALGELEAAEPLLVALERRGRGLSAAQAHFMRAKQAEREARFADCLELCNRALGSINVQDQAHRQLSSVAFTPSVAGLRGLALAALGRPTEAAAELATIARDHSAWSHRASTELRIRLMLAVKSGDLEAARAIARERTPELPITLRDETLADLVLATAPEGASRDEQERVDSEIRDDLTIRTWIDAVAPALRDDLGRRVSAKGVRVEHRDERPRDESEIEEIESDRRMKLRC